MILRSFLARLTAALLALGTSVAWAAGDDRPIVALTFVGSAADRAAFTGSLSELLMRLGVDVSPRVTDGPLPKDRLLAEVTADWSVPSQATITILDSQGRTVLVRRLARGGSQTVVIEAAAHIIQSVIEELVAPSDPPPLVSAGEIPVLVAKPIEEQSNLGFDVGAFLGGRGQGGSTPIAWGGGLSTAVTLAGRWRPSIWLNAEFQPPAEIHSQIADHDYVQLTMQSAVLRAGPGARLIGRAGWALDAALGAGADLIFTRPHSYALSPRDVRPERIDVDPVFTGALTLHIAVARSADLFLSLSADVDLAPRRFVIDLPGSREVIFSPWRVRPALTLGFNFAAIGPDPFRARLGAGP